MSCDRQSLQITRLLTEADSHAAIVTKVDAKMAMTALVALWSFAFGRGHAHDVRPFAIQTSGLALSHRTAGPATRSVSHDRITTELQEHRGTHLAD
jgi:hypothetical protein